MAVFALRIKKEKSGEFSAQNAVSERETNPGARHLKKTWLFIRKIPQDTGRFIDRL